MPSWKDCKVAVVIVNYNGWVDSITCLQSLQRSSFRDFFVILVDNGSSDGSFQHIRQWAEGKLCAWLPPDHPLHALVNHPALPCQFFETAADQTDTAPAVDSSEVLSIWGIRLQENRGYAAGVNAGLRLALSHSRSVYFWILNNDTLIHPDALAHLVHYLEQPGRQRVGMVGGKLLYDDKPQIIQAVGGRFFPWLGYVRHIGEGQRDTGQFDATPKHMDYIVGAAMMVRRAFVEQVGLMNEDYFLYFEELDWVERGKRLGWQIGYCSQARIYHKEGHITGATRNKAQKSEMADLYLVRNRFRFIRRYYPWCLPGVYLTLPLLIWRRVWRGQWNRIPKLMKIALTHDL